MEEKEIDRYLLEENLFSMFCAQIMKDFEGSGLSSDMIEGLSKDPMMVKGVILNAVKSLSSKNSEGLRRLLYRVDISERQLGNYQVKDPGKDFEELLAELIIKRILQKVIIRKKMSDG